MTDFRALCEELLGAIQLYTKLNPAASEMSAFELTEKLMDAMSVTAAALAEQPVVPTDEELNDTYWAAWHKHLDRTNSVLHSVGLRAVLARWGQP
jgi:hypothetical protein